LVSLPLTREVRDYEDFPGRTEAISSIDVRARVTGYLDKVNFKDGQDVREGDVLFEIDARPYQADLNRAEANLVQAQAHLTRLDADYRRATGLLPSKVLSREEFDKVSGDREEANAAVGVAKANRDLANLNLNFTKVRASISGRVSRRYIDPGNLVKADDTVLTSLVSLGSVYAYFDVDERTTLRLQELARTGKIKWSSDGSLPVLLRIVNEEGFPHEGKVNFADNRIDPDTGTWRLRGLFPNRRNMLSAGLYVHIRLPIGDPYRATLVSEQAIGTDQGQKYLYVVKTVNDAEQVEYRRVIVGRLHEGLRVITEGLSAGEKVVVSGLQRIRPGSQIKPKMVDMPVQNAKSEPQKLKPDQPAKST
jgi:RND family efflux transporter MFP subunit